MKALVCSAFSFVLFLTDSSTLGYNVSSGENGLGRRAFMMNTILVGFPVAASAAYGDSTKMELPNYIEYLIEKNKAGIEGETSLYAGADPNTLLQRLLSANTKLAEIPKLAEQKKWSQVQGVLTGPLGSLSETLNLIVKIAPTTQAAAKRVKSDLILIGLAATKKDAVACTVGTTQAKEDLMAFAKAAFQ